MATAEINVQTSSQNLEELLLIPSLTYLQRILVLLKATIDQVGVELETEFICKEIFSFIQRTPKAPHLHIFLNISPKLFPVIKL